jgi:hypothetical protein
LPCQECQKNATICQCALSLKRCIRCPYHGLGDSILDSSKFLK